MKNLAYRDLPGDERRHNSLGKLCITEVEKARRSLAGLGGCDAQQKHNRGAMYLLSSLLSVVPGAPLG